MKLRLGYRAALAGLCALSALLAPEASAEDRALIVGINHYAYLPKESQLYGSVNDAHLIEHLARDGWGFKPEQIKVLLDGEATADAIRTAFVSWLVEGSSPGDRVLFYFSGHGYFTPDLDGDEPDGKDETLVAADARPTSSGLSNMVVDDEIHEQLMRLKGRSVMVIADSCHSGSITRAFDPASVAGESIEKFPRWPSPTRGADAASDSSAEVSKDEFAKLRQGKPFFHDGAGALAWTAVAATEIAQEDMTMPPQARDGVFTRYFGAGISDRAADANGDGVVSAAELLEYVRLKTREYCARNRCITGMTPTFEPGGEELSRDMLVWARPQGVAAQPQPTPGPAPTPQLPSPDNVLPGTGSTFDVSLELLPGREVMLGEEIKLKVTSSKPGYLLALDVRNDGRVVQLFPSNCSPPQRTVRANAALTMPDPTYGCTFIATERGTGKIIALVSEDNIPIDSLIDRHKGLDVVAQPSAYLAEIASALLAVWTADERNRPIKWGLAVQEYVIK